METTQLELTYWENIYELPDESRGSWPDRYPVRLKTYHKVYPITIPHKLHASVQLERTLNMAPNQ